MSLIQLLAPIFKMLNKTAVVLSFILATIIWSNILTSLFAGSLGDLFGMAIMLFLSLGAGMLFLFVQTKVENLVFKIFIYFLFLIALMLIHPVFHFSSPQPYEAIKKSYKYLKNYDSINYYNVYEDTDMILKTVSFYKFKNVLPEKGFAVIFGIPKLTENCPGCSDDTLFYIECNGLNCSSNYNDIKISRGEDTVIFEAKFKGEIVKFNYSHKEINPSFKIDKDPYISAFELEKEDNWGFLSLLKDYLEDENYPQVLKK